MTARRAAVDPALPDGRLDWSRARTGDPSPCEHCGQGAIMRHPVTGRACHKVCDTIPPAADTTPGRVRTPRHRQTATTDRSAA